MDTHRIERAVRAAAAFTFARSGGPGGQNVNKVSSKAVLRLPLGRFASLASLSDAELARVREKLGRRLNDRGDLVVTVQDTRDQAKNRELAVERVLAVLKKALHRDKLRRATKPTRASKERRISSKKAVSATKRDRGRPDLD